MSLMRRVLRRIHRRGVDPAPPFRVFRLMPKGRPRGRALISMGFQVYEQLRAGKPIPTNHPAAWKNWNVARSLLDLGFVVDAAPSRSDIHVDDKSFDVVIDVRANLEYLSARLKAHGTRVYYPQFGHWTVHNGGQIDRHRNLLFRRGLSLLPARLIAPTLSVECADWILSPGGGFSNRAFAHCQGSLHAVEQSPPAAWIRNLSRDMEEARRHFVWIGGAGAVHKGLDLCLEAFSRSPELHLHICGDIRSERAFYASYREELEATPNIHYHGWTDTCSEQWLQVVSRCAFVLLHSASEVAATSPVAGMYAGLIPVVNDGADQRIASGGPEITGESVEGLIECIGRMSTMGVRTLSDRSREAFESATRGSDQESFMRSLRQGLAAALGIGSTINWDLRDRPGKQPADLPAIEDVTFSYVRPRSAP